MAHTRTADLLQAFREHALDLGAAFMGTVDGVYPVMHVSDGYFACPYCAALHRAPRTLGHWTHVPCTVLPAWVRGCGVFPVVNVEQAVTLEGFEPTSLVDWVEWRTTTRDRRSA
jgi:hypothetical protein